MGGLVSKVLVIAGTGRRLIQQQQELASRTQIDRTYVSGIERQVRNPTITVVAKFAEALNTTTADLLCNSGE
ncbi:helix-turn-helix domain-containing protein [Agrobacterium sp. 22-226-1]